MSFPQSLIVFALASVLFSVLSDVSVAEKPGLCPYAPPRMFCPHIALAECDSDEDCPGAAKCCAHGASNCGFRRCKTNLLVHVTRPGTCPPEVDFGHPAYRPAICDMFQCGDDGHCPENHKCCTNGCGSTECIPMA